MRCSIAPHCREFDEDTPVGAEAETVLCERGAEEITTEVLQTSAIVGGNPDVGVEVEAVELGLPRAVRGDVTEVRLVAEAADTGAEGDAALDGGPDEAAQGRRGFGQRVRRGRIVGRLEVAGRASSRPTRARTMARMCATSASLSGGAG